MQIEPRQPCPRSCRLLYASHPAPSARSYRYRSGIYLPCLSDVDRDVEVDDLSVRGVRPRPTQVSDGYTSVQLKEFLPQNSLCCLYHHIYYSKSMHPVHPGRGGLFFCVCRCVRAPARARTSRSCRLRSVAVWCRCCRRCCCCCCCY